MQSHPLQMSITRESVGWIEAGWLRPDTTSGADQLSETDCARAQLIVDLKSMGANDEAIPIILDLIDQMHGLRRQLRLFASRATEEWIERLAQRIDADH